MFHCLFDYKYQHLIVNTQECGYFFNTHYREDHSRTAARECYEETLGVLGTCDELYAMAGHDDVFKVIVFKLTCVYVNVLCRYTIQAQIM